jgi:glycosyltransferase involved in cell wall biosynthesis
MAALTSIVIPLKNPGPALVPMLNNLIECTAEPYEVVVVDRGSQDGTGQILAQLGGDVRVVTVDARCSVAEALNEATPKTKGDVMVVATVGARFTPSWLSGVRNQLSGSFLASVDGVSPADLFAIRIDALRAFGPFAEGAADDQIANEYVQRIDSLNRRAEQAGALGIPRDALGLLNGNALAHLVLSAGEGAAIGQLPVDHAERLRDRLAQEEERRLLLQARAGRDVCWTDEGEAEPLVTVRVVTYNRAEQLMDICMPSVLGQSYENLDVLIIGDHTDEATEKAVRSIDDPRVRYFNLPARPLYPKHAWDWWKIVGSQAMNLAIELANGSWINPADDDDELSPDHVEVLFREARERSLEYVWSKTLMRHEEGWQIVGSEPMGAEATTHCAVMWSSGLRFMRMSTTCWKFQEEADQNMWRRMFEIGVRMGFVPKVTYRYLPGSF